MRVIRRFARQVGERFQPDKIMLFGSYAYGKPHADSDVDILVVMPCRNPLRQAQVA
jgi:predicted nucleotidyltransferase